MMAEFDARYPPEQRCDPSTDGCWRAQGFPDRTFAFSADGILDRPAYSRRVIGHRLRRSGLGCASGSSTSCRYNWNSQVSDVERATRDRRSWRFPAQWRLEMPWFVMYRFPADFAGSALCWRGEVLWEGAAEQFDADPPSRRWHAARSPLTTSGAGSSVWRSAMNRRSPCGSNRL